MADKTQNKNGASKLSNLQKLFQKESQVEQRILTEEERKGQVFSYFLIAVLIGVAVLSLDNIYRTVFGDPSNLRFLPTNIGLLIFFSLIWLGHRWYPVLMRHVFLVIIIVGTIFFFDITILDRVFLVLTLPITMAAFLIKPVYSFVYYFISAFTYILRLYMAGITATDEQFSTVNLLTLVVVAVVAWLMAQSLDKALSETRALNVELDQRVQDRTRELAESLGREHAIATQNQTILASIADGIVVFDAQQRIAVANPAANELAGQDLQSMQLTDFIKSIEDNAKKALQAWLSGSTPEGQKNIRFKWRNKTLSANVAPVALIEGEDKRVGIGNVMVLRDFTKEAELERAKDLFLSTVSHELRTPMSAIQGYVEVLLDIEKERMSADGYEYLQTINASIKQLLTLANELIDLSRLETGEIDLYCDWVELAPIVNNAVKIVQQEFTGRNLSLEVNIEEPLPKLYVDNRRILQILLNLLSNAYKYTLKGGAVINVDQSDEWVNISVSDTGIGIKEADQAKLFKRFFRADDQRVQRVSGSGLGLNISKGFTELHGGKLTCESRYGKGTTVTVSLPKDQSAFLEDAE